MIKKAYQKPTTKVVKLQHQTHILAGSIQTLQGRKGDATSQDEDQKKDIWYYLE